MPGKAGFAARARRPGQMGVAGLPRKREPTTARRLLLAAFGLLLLGGVWFLTGGAERVWTWYAGPADQGRVPTLGAERRQKPTDSLACSPGICAARLDISLPDYREPPAELIQRLDRIILSDRRLARVDDGSRPDYRRYVARTPVLRFPDTIEARALARGEGSALILYGRSLLGANDWGANHGRLALWAAELDDLRVVPAAVTP